MDSSASRSGWKLTWVVTLLAVYVASYGFVRWRKVLVRYEYYSDFKAGPLVSEIGSGVDLRKSGIGVIKNTLAKPISIIFTPLRNLESVIRTRFP